jgi:uncharacterized membrane-anchored protein
MLNKKQLVLIILFPLVLITIFFAPKLLTLSQGENIVLKVEPVDPRDMFRGDYVTLSYEISRMDLEQIPLDSNYSTGDTIYATLSKKEKYWSIDSVSHTKPLVKSGEVGMKGTVTSAYGNMVTVEWGIESYFVPEGKGKIIEGQINSGNVSAIVAVDSAGSSVLKELRINDEPLGF